MSAHEYLVNEYNKSGQCSLVLVVRGWLPTQAQLTGWNKTGQYVTQEDMWAEMQTLDIKAYERKNPYNNTMYTQPRINYACADETLVGTTYGRVQIPFNKWVPGCLNLRDRIQNEAQIFFNSCLINGYRDENDMVDYHGDKEALGNKNAVITVSVGETRYFAVTRNSDDKECGTYLNSGDLVLMMGDTQKTHKHAIPREKVKRGLRYSITYRLMSPSNYSHY